MAGGDVFVLRHGTTRRRAEAIFRSGPDPRFREPGEVRTLAEGFSTSPSEGPFPYGSPEQHARGKAALFPDEGEAVILEMDVPLEIIDLAVVDVGEVRFSRGWGLDELLQAWPALDKRIMPV